MTSMVIIFVLLAATVLLFFGRFAEYLLRKRNHRESTEIRQE